MTLTRPGELINNAKSLLNDACIKGFSADHCKQLNDLLDQLESNRKTDADRKLNIIDQHVTDIIWHLDENTVFTYISPSVKNILGYKPEEVIGKSVIEFIPDEYRDKAKENINFRLNSNESETNRFFEYEMITNNGRRIPVEVNSVAVHDGNGKFIGFSGITRDITERKKSERALQKSEERMKFLAQSALDLTALEKEEEIFRYITETVYKIHGSHGIIIATDIDESTNSWRVRSIKGLGELTKKLFDLLKYDPEKLQGKLKDGNLITLKPGKIHKMESDLTSLTHGALSGRVVKNIQKLIGINTVYTISFTKKERHFGNLSFISKSEDFQIDTELIEALIAQVTVFLERRIAIEALRENEEKYRLLLENAGVGIGYYDLDGKLLFLNEIASEYMGGKPEEFTGKTLPELYGENEGEKYRRRLKKTATFNKTLQFEDEVDLPGGTMWFVSTYNCIHNANGTVIGVQVISQDITKSKLAEQARIESEEKLKYVINHSNDLFYIHDTGHRITYVSPQCREIFGLSEEEMKRNWTELVTDHPLNKIGFKHTEKAIETGNAQPAYPLQVRDKYGKSKWLEALESPIKNEKGEVVAMVGGLRDITEQRKDHEKLQESEQKYRLLFERSSDAHLIMNEYHYTDANDAAAEIFGFENTSKIVGLSPADISPAYQPDGQRSSVKAKQLIYQAFETGYNRFEWLHHDKSGKDIWFDISLTRITEKGKNLLHVVLRDINQSKRYRDELARINRILQETGKIAKVGGWEFDVETGEGYWTDEVARIHEVEPGTAMTSNSALSFYEGESKKKIDEAIELLKAKGETYDLEVELTTDKGNKKWIRTIGHPVFENGKVIKAVGSLQDITGKKEAEIKIQNYRDHLEDLVKERTKELEESNEQLERMNNLFVGREFRIKELRTQIENLKKEAGQKNE